MLVHCENIGHAYNNHYYLASSIYPDWSTLVKTIHVSEKEKKRGLANNKRLVRRMWSGHLICSNLGGLLFGTLLEHGALKPCIR
jgi:hypothetical protein